MKHLIDDAAHGESEVLLNPDDLVRFEHTLVVILDAPDAPGPDSGRPFSWKGGC